jgi:phenylacetate-CoA ligase
VVTRDGLMDNITVRCEVTAEHGNADRDALARSLQQRIKSVIGISAAVEVGLPDSIERTLVGKAQRVFDRRPR